MGETVFPDFDRRTADAVLAAFDIAIAEAGLYAGATAPNPPVGCLLLDSNGDVIATGVHRKAGTAHAEAMAIAVARAAGRIGDIDTVVVTLEPCNHHGRTPPCVEAILGTPARHIFIGVADPNPAVTGGGAARLKAAGRTVTFLSEIPGDRARFLDRASRRLIAPFVSRATTGKPWVTVKQAVNADGTMIPPRGQKTFTAPASLKIAHRLRKRADAILTGSGTILADNPEFTVRRVSDFEEKRRFLAILDRRHRVSESYFAAAAARGFDVFRADSLEAALERLGAAGVLEVLVEAGPALSGAILKAGLWDEHVLISKSARHDTADRVQARYRKHDFDDLNDAALLPGEDE